MTPSPEKATCPECGREFDSPMALAVHSRSHDPETVECPDCGGHFKKGPGFAAHRRSAHGSQRKGKKKDCPECGKAISAKDLQRHRRQVHGVDRVPSPGRPAKIERTEWDVDDIFNTVVEVMWPKGLVPAKAFVPLMHWREATAKMLIEVEE